MDTSGARKREMEYVEAERGVKKRREKNKREEKVAGPDVRGAISPGRSFSGSESSASVSFQAQVNYSVFDWPVLSGAVRPGEASQAVSPRHFVLSGQGRRLAVWQHNG